MANNQFTLNYQVKGAEPGTPAMKLCDVKQAAHDVVEYKLANSKDIGALELMLIVAWESKV